MSNTVGTWNNKGRSKGCSNAIIMFIDSTIYGMCVLYLDSMVILGDSMHTIVEGILMSMQLVLG